jgi:uncharacterized protein (DUF433 family)
MTAVKSVVHSDPDILGGTPVFVGTRFPVRTLLDYLAAGERALGGTRALYLTSAFLGR